MQLKNKENSMRLKVHNIVKRHFILIILIIFCGIVNAENSLLKVNLKKIKKTAVNPTKISFKDLFTSYPKSAIYKLSAKIEDFISIDEFTKLIVDNVDMLSEDDFKIIEKTLINLENINVPKIGLGFIKSKNLNLYYIGFELISKACIDGNRFFEPNKFYMAFAEKGYATEPFLIEIIENTDDDFCREWASELYVDIYYNNTDESDKHHLELAQKNIQEKELFRKLEQIFSNPQIIANLVDENKSLADLIKKEWGEENRYSMKMIVIIKLLDQLNQKNFYSITQRIKKFSVHLIIIIIY